MAIHDRVAKIYDTILFQFFYLWSHKYSTGFIKDFLPKNSRILDIACATGNFLYKLQNLGMDLKLFGVDESQAMIKRAQRKFQNIDFITCKAEGLPFTKEYFDLITICDAFYYFKDKEKVISECSRVLKAGGCLFIFYPAIDLFPQLFLKIIKWFSRYFFFNLEQDTHFIPVNELVKLADKYDLKLIKKKLKSLNWFFVFQKT
ncbi:class I SAM-dependent methyltransferase [Patescibacteria group bacterium]|nr:class I SAM-dependent methyltransferase [Patescibacteria group bacterium]